jgi:hypothetical protein
MSTALFLSDLEYLSQEEFSVVDRMVHHVTMDNALPDLLLSMFRAVWNTA